MACHGDFVRLASTPHLGGALGVKLDADYQTAGCKDRSTYLVPTRIGTLADADMGVGRLGREKVPTVTPLPSDTPERLVKSAERVRDLAEVFTPAATVQEMLDMLPEDIWEVHPASTFLEPACGDGNFLVAILNRKFARIAEAQTESALPAGQTDEALQFHLLEALSSVYGVDISSDNIVGGTPGHELGARQRIMELVAARYRELSGKIPRKGGRFMNAAQWIVDRNIQVANMLPELPDGTKTDRKSLWMVTYTWKPEPVEVSVSFEHFDSIVDKAHAVSEEGTLSFGEMAQSWWHGDPLALAESGIASGPEGLKLTARQRQVRNAG